MRLSHGAIKVIAERLGVPYTTAHSRLRSGNMEAIKIAIEVEREFQEERRKKEQEKRQALIQLAAFHSVEADRP